jgi:hypothetical protein
MATEYYVKTLRLAPPQLVNRLGIPAETPVFLSPQVNNAQRCASCGVTYSPLLYAVGRITTAQHFHDDCGGGIYIVLTSSLAFTASLAVRSGWIAEVEPIGKTSVVSGDGTCRAETVLVRAITAWCMHHSMAVGDILNRQHTEHVLTEGIVFAHPAWRHEPGNLLPLCGPDDLELQRAPFRFQVRDDIVYFQQRS